jgi:hypothetical protein
MSESKEKARAPRWRQLGVNLAILLITVLFTVAVLEIALRFYPRLVPLDVPTFPPARRYSPNADTWLDYKRSSGDLFVRMSGAVEPLDPAEDRLLERVHLQLDHAGFRNAEPWRATYDLVALGDSFTYGIATPIPWTERVAQLTGKSVLNLGQEGIGPLEERDLFFDYGRAKSPSWVVVMFFEGNDFNDARSYLQASPLIVTRLGRFALNKITSAFAPASVPTSNAPTPSRFIYPLTLASAKQNVTLFNFYLSWLTPHANDLAASQNLRGTREAFQAIQSETKKTGAHLLIVYAPSKEHLIVPELSDAQRARVFQNVPAVEMDKNGFLIQGTTPVDPNQVLAHINDQRDTVQRVTSELGAEFLDLTPCLAQKTKQGAVLYYEYDTHWNQAGHNLAAELIANYVEHSQVICR